MHKSSTNFIGIFKKKCLLEPKCLIALLSCYTTLMMSDKGSLAHLVALAGISGRFSNIKKKIVRCGNYEFHHQHHQAAQLALLSNMYANYVKIQGVDEAEELHGALVLPQILVALQQEHVLAAVAAEDGQLPGPLLRGYHLRVRSKHSDCQIAYK